MAEKVVGENRLALFAHVKEDRCIIARGVRMGQGADQDGCAGGHVVKQRIHGCIRATSMPRQPVSIFMLSSH